jgi:hypothetical protein
VLLLLLLLLWSIIIRSEIFSLFCVYTVDSEKYKRQLEKEEKDATTMMGMDETTDVVGESAEHSCNIVRVCQRIKVELDAHELNSKGGNEEIWALVEFEIFDPDQPEPMAPSKRTKKWKKFDSESELSDFIRRDTGEPLTLPPYSLTPQQSAKIQHEAKKSVSQITEEFRRFRVKAEMARKQSDAQIRDLQSNNVESAKRRIEGKDVVRFHVDPKLLFLIMHSGLVGFS